MLIVELRKNSFEYKSFTKLGECFQAIFDDHILQGRVVYFADLVRDEYGETTIVLDGQFLIKQKRKRYESNSLLSNRRFAIF